MVEYHLLKKVGEFLQEEGLDLADNKGRIRRDWWGYYTTMGILMRRWNFFGLRRKRRRMFIGVLHFEKEEWIIDLYGRQNIFLAVSLAEKMFSIFKVDNIEIYLKSEEPRYERYWGESVR